MLSFTTHFKIIEMELFDKFTKMMIFFKFSTTVVSLHSFIDARISDPFHENPSLCI